MSTSTQKLVFLLGANHQSAALELREKLFIPAERLALLLPDLKERFGFLELVALSTCNRFELMGVLPPAKLAIADAFSSEDKLYEAYFELQRAAHNLQKINVETLKESLYLHLNRDALRHIHRVAASLDSLVLGETQITGQFKDAVALAAEAKTLGPTLSRLSQEVLATAKKIRTQTAIGQKHVSISHAAIELAKKVFGDLSAHKFLIIGAGEMAQVAAKYIQSYTPRSLLVANRTVVKAQEMVHALGYGEAFSLEELPNLLPEVDIVLSSTAASGLILTADMVRRAQLGRRSRPLFLLDIALPRDIDPECGKLDDVYLFDIDDLQQVVGANYEERRLAAEAAQVMVDRGVESFEKWLATFAITPALAGFRNFLDDLVSKEMEKTFARDHLKDLSSKQRDSLDAMVTAIVGKISAEASRRIKEPPPGYFAEQLAEALNIIFSVPKLSSEVTANSDHLTPNKKTPESL